MITKITYGNPFNTEAVCNLPETANCLKNPSAIQKGTVSLKNGFEYSFDLKESSKIYGLGENLGGIDKRGKKYVSWCSDDPNHTEEKSSLYGAHNFIAVYDFSDKTAFGLFFDYPGQLTFDAGFTAYDKLTVSCADANLDLYMIEPEDNKKPLLSIVSQFRNIIGKSYIPPKWAFGYMQSRWGYGSEEDLNKVYEKYRSLEIPLDAIFLDIDYMKDFRDFTWDENKFADFKKAVSNLKDKNIHIVPIIDAGIKASETDPVDVEGLSKDYFCKKQDGKVFAAGVWPGLSHFTDYLNPEARKWFGSKYSMFLDAGIDGFWNDMNEPALFYSEDGIIKTFKELKEKIEKESSNLAFYSTWEIKDKILGIQNNMEDYKSFYHKVPVENAGAYGEKTDEGTALVRHDLVHNLYGYNMTRAASEYFESVGKKNDVLLFSRSSYIGAHRYGGIWTGDNMAWWSHLLLCLKQLPSLNMCGFIYTGCDLGGFGADTSRELLLRFLSLGVFTPLMRNHSALGTREQECYQFEKPEDFRAVINLRYRLLPYLYKTAKECALQNKMYFKPLSFDYPEDKNCLSIEDQLMLGEDLMIAPVYTPNCSARSVYLPEAMTMVVYSGEKTEKPFTKKLKKGLHFVEMPANKVVFFIKKGHKLPLVDAALCSAEINENSVIFL